MIRPKKERFLELARPDHVVAVVKELPSDVITPVDAYYATDASYLLESSERGMAVGRYSFMGIEPEVLLSINGEECRVDEGGEFRTYSSEDPLRLAGELLRRYPWVGEGDLSLFPGGAVGYVGYEMVRRWENLPDESAKPGLKLPESRFMVTRLNLVFDNLMHSIKIICNQRVGKDPGAAYESALQGIACIERRLEEVAGARRKKTGQPGSGPLISTFPKKSFMASVQKIREMLAAGEAIQVVLSQRLHLDYYGDPFLVYRALRSINPSPYMFFLNFGEFSIFGASPEVMVKVEGSRAMLRPIAGTRPRGKDAEEDALLRQDLLSDEKERAEHLMLVDLGRNDLGRIAEPGTVTVDRMMDIEMYSHVMHIVSEVSATLDSRVDVFDVIKAVFPAGTVSGAPKVRAMQLISELEPVQRGPYAGLIGYLSYTGAFDSCITIRSMVHSGNRLYLQVGAGIVHDSDPEKEYQETINKAKALIRALSLERK